MKKTLIKALVVSCLFLWMGNNNIVNAGDLDWFEAIFNDISDNTLNCPHISKEISFVAPRVQSKIASLFSKLSSQWASSKSTYQKLERKATQYLLKTNKNTQKRMYTILWYIKCESQMKLKRLAQQVVPDQSFHYQIDGLWNIHYIEGGQFFYIETIGKYKMSNVKRIWNFLIYDVNSMPLPEKHIYDIISKRLLSSVINWKLFQNHMIYGCVWSGFSQWYIQTLNLNTKKFTSFLPNNLSVRSCNTSWNYMYFTVMDHNSDTEQYVYNLSTSRLFVNSVRLNSTWWTGVNRVFKAIYKKKKWDFKKYIWWGVEARQNSLYTYFYYDNVLINTVKNTINKDKYVLWCWNQANWYLSSQCARKKLDLYSASTKRPIIFFKKRIDNWVTHFSYNINTGKFDDFNN